MINYTERLTLLMYDIVTRVPTLSFIDIADVLVFARAGRSNAEGAFATCHCLTLPPSEPGYYFWRDRATKAITRRSEWFVTKSPVVTVGTRERSRKELLYPGADPWIAKLDTVIHELYHIDPELAGIRRIEREDGTYSAHCYGDQFFEQVAEMVHTYLATDPSPAMYDFLGDDFAALEARHGGIVGTSFRSFPSFPQRYIERLPEQPPCDADTPAVKIEPLRVPKMMTRYTQDDLDVRQFTKNSARRLIRKGACKAA